jgi:hypothetical protein
MTAISTHNELLSRITNGYEATEPIHGNFPVVRANPVTGLAGHRAFYTPSVPSSLASGVTAHIPTQVHGGSSLLGVFIGYCEMINLGSIDLSTNTFTAGSTMGTTTFGGQTVSRSGVLWLEVTTALNATPGTLTVTYVDQSGNAAEAAAGAALTASTAVGSGGFLRINGTDGAVREVTTAAQSGGTSPTGVIKFWGLIPISSGVSNGGHGGFVLDAFNKRPLYRLPASAVTGGITIGSTAAGGVEGSVRLVGDQA